MLLKKIAVTERSKAVVSNVAVLISKTLLIVAFNQGSCVHIYYTMDILVIRSDTIMASDHCLPLQRTNLLRLLYSSLSNNSAADFLFTILYLKSKTSHKGKPFPWISLPTFPIF